MSNVTEKKTKGFMQKIATLTKPNEKPYTLAEVKKMAKKFDTEAKKNKGKYIIRARNEYKDNLTIRSYDGKFYDEEDDDYYDARGYQKDKYEKFYKLQIIYVK